MASNRDSGFKVETKDPVVQPISLCETKTSEDRLVPMTAEDEKALVRKIDRQ